MVINQDDIFWIELDEPSSAEPGYRHPLPNLPLHSTSGKRGASRIE
jgi:hypothetical protein